MGLTMGAKVGRLALSWEDVIEAVLHDAIHLVSLLLERHAILETALTGASSVPSLGPDPVILEWDLHVLV